MIRLGLRWRQLGTEALTWRDLKVIVAERPPSSALTRATDPATYEATLRLLEFLSFQLQTANVLHGNQSGARPHEFPKPPSWVEGPKDETRIGSDPIPYDEMAAWLGGDFLNL